MHWPNLEFTTVADMNEFLTLHKEKLSQYELLSIHPFPDLGKKLSLKHWHSYQINPMYGSTILVDYPVFWLHMARMLGH